MKILHRLRTYNFYLENHINVFPQVTMLHLYASGEKRFNSLTSKGKGFSLRHSIPTDLADNPTSYAVNAASSCWGVDRSYFLLLKLRASGGIPPFPICRNFLCLIKHRAKFTCTFRNSAVSSKTFLQGAFWQLQLGSAYVIAWLSDLVLT